MNPGAFTLAASLPQKRLKLNNLRFYSYSVQKK